MEDRMSILSVDNISPIGSGTSVTINNAATLVLTNANSTGVITATSFVGALPISSDGNNRVITATGSGGLNGESTLTFDGTNFSVTGAANVAGTLILQPGGTAWSTTNTRPQLGRQADGELRLGAGSDSSSIITFYTSPSAGGTLAEALRIASDGDVGIGTNSPVERVHIHKESATGPHLYITNTSTGVTSGDGVRFGFEGSNNAEIKNLENTSLLFGTNATIRAYFNNSGHFLPNVNNTYDLGSTALGWRNVYMNDLNLSNMNGDTNDVDGTQGSWTIQEGKDDLYIINRLNGKKFKIKMEEIS
jgi:hypothetical protein